MKKLWLLATLMMATSAFAQFGPTPPSAALAWAQGVPSSTSGPVTANCVYRSLVSGSPVIPAVYCSTTPITAWTDNTVSRGTTYYYWITAKATSSESAYSNMATAVIPSSITPPVLNTPAVTSVKIPVPFGAKDVVLAFSETFTTK